jgi:hypothetical protein
MNSRLWIRLFGATLLIGAANPHFTLGQEQCDSLLRHGIYDQLSESGASSNHSASQSEMCRAYQQYESDAKAGNTSGSYALFSGSLALSSQQIKSIGESMCQSASSQFDASTFAQLNKSVISQPAVDAWQACVTQQKAIAVTTNFADTDQGTTGVTLTFHKSAAGASGDQIKWISASANLECKGGTLNALINQNAGVTPSPLGLEDNTLVCSRTVANTPFQAGSRTVYADDSYVTVSTTAGDITRRLPAILPPPPPNPIPRGTIVAWYSSSGPIPVGWGLCDGTQGTPDLRDRFLMGTGAYPEVGKQGGSNQQTVTISIDRLYLDTTNNSGIAHDRALREDQGRGVINHQTTCPNCNLVDSFTAPASKSGQFDGRPAYVAILYIIKL